MNSIIFTDNVCFMPTNQLFLDIEKSRESIIFFRENNIFFISMSLIVHNLCDQKKRLYNQFIALETLYFKK